MRAGSGECGSGKRLDDRISDGRARRARDWRRRCGVARRDRGVGARREAWASFASRCSAKAHTVMAEGGMAAAMGNVDDRDNWRVHFADTMRGGQYLNNWRMAELHAKEAPERVKELEAWGALFDRTADGRILQRNFRRPSLSAPRARRRSHGPRADSHAAGPRRASGHRRAHGGHRPHAAQGRRSHRRRVRLRPRARSLPSLQGQGRRAGDGRHRARVQDHVEQLGVHRRRPCVARTTPAPTSRTWSSCSSTRRE